MSIHRAWAALAALTAASCLGSPELRDCIDFEFGTEGCPTRGCDLYCESVLDRCPDAFASEEVCISNCSLEQVNPLIDTDEVLVEGQRTGNTLSCRLTFLRERSCTEASLTESVACTGPSPAQCDEYCALMAASCDGAYPDLNTCEKNCALFPIGPQGDDSDANTVACRLRYARDAAQDASGMACQAASLNGGGVCGSNPCEPYCDLVLRNCTGENLVYDTEQECLEVCSFMDGTGSFDDWDFDIEGDSVQCRSYHAGPPAETLPALHCPHVRFYNDEHCGVVPNVVNQPPDWPCIAFCGVMARSCPGTFADDAECRATCATLPEVTMFGDDGPQLFPVSTTICPDF